MPTITKSFAIFLIVAQLLPNLAWACHPVLKCVGSSANGHIAYFSFEGGEANLAIGAANRFSGALGCTSLGKDCGQGTHFVNNGPYEQDKFGSDSIVSGQTILPVAFSSSVTWTLSSGSVTATTSSLACATPTPTASSTPTSTPTLTPTTTRTPSPTPTATPTVTKTPTPTLFFTPSASPTPSPSQTATSTSTPFPSLTATATMTPVSTPTSTATATASPTVTATSSPTITNSASPTPTPTESATPEVTPLLPTSTPSDQPSRTPTPDATPSTDTFDCAGVANGKSTLDCCGVCAGDGSTCLDLCKQVETIPLKKKIRRKVRLTAQSIFKRISQEHKCQPNRKGGAKRRTETTLLLKQIGLLLEGIQDNFKVCDTVFCKKASYKELNAEITVAVTKLVKLDKLSQYKALDACCGRNGCSNRPHSQVPQRSDNVIDTLIELPPERCD